MKNLQTYAVVAALSVLTLGCGGKSEEETARDEPQNLTEGIEKFKEEAEKIGNGEVKELVSPKLLKELLPNDADGLARKEASSEKVGAMGVGISQAEGIYKGDGDERITVTIMDFAGSVGALAGAAWTMVEIDKETENGYERNTKYKGRKALEQYDNTRKDGEIKVMVGNRFMVEVKGRNVSIDKITATLDDIDLDKLGNLK
jgi:hypothetical protein